MLHGVYFGILMRKNAGAAFTNRRALWHTNRKAIRITRSAASPEKMEGSDEF
jgi:hypothetical protein